MAHADKDTWLPMRTNSFGACGRVQDFDLTKQTVWVCPTHEVVLQNILTSQTRVTKLKSPGRTGTRAGNGGMSEWKNDSS